MKTELVFNLITMLMFSVFCLAAVLHEAFATDKGRYGYGRKTNPLNPVFTSSSEKSFDRAPYYIKRVPSTAIRPIAGAEPTCQRLSTGLSMETACRLQKEAVFNIKYLIINLIN